MEKTLQMPPEYYINFVKELRDNAEKISNNYFYISHETIKNEDNFLDLCSSIDIEVNELINIP